jgi:hypothetical protein
MLIVQFEILNLKFEIIRGRKYGEDQEGNR